MATIHNLRIATAAKRRVLVVEDNLDSVHSMATLIKLMGHDVRFAINGFAALSVARAFRPQIVLLDISLPDFSGEEIARQLKFEPGLEGVRIIAITGLPNADELQEKMRSAGCEEFYKKPIDPVTLEALLGSGDPPVAGSARL